MAYKYPTSRPIKITTPKVRYANAVIQDEMIGPISGIMPDSKEEWRFARALSNNNIDFDYQFSLNGGRSRAGGIVLDFLVHTPVAWTPVFIQGKFWHKNAEEDFMKLANTSDYLKALGIKAKDPVEVWDYQIPDMMRTNMKIKELFA